MANASKTLFQQDADWNLQSSTKGGAAKIDALAIAIGAVILALFFVFQDDWFRWVLLIIGGLALLAGLAMLRGDLTKPTKTVICPKCSTEHQIFQSVRRYPCTNCRTLLLMTEDDTISPQFCACPYCGLETAVTHNYGQFLCSNCGIVREPAATKWERAGDCPTCGKAIPDGVIYCSTCKKIFITDFSQPLHGDDSFNYGLEWEMGKDAEGHLQYARSLLISIRVEAETTGMDLDDLVRIDSLLGQMGKALKSVEEALQNPELRSTVVSMVPEIDRTYATLLEQLSGLLAFRLLYDPEEFNCPFA